MNNRKYLQIIKEIEKCRYIKAVKDCIYSELSFRYPKKVFEYRIINNNVLFYICPSCRSTIDREYVRYCVNCGQHLSWRGAKKYAKEVYK